MTDASEHIRCPHCSIGEISGSNDVHECPHLIAAVSWGYENDDSDFPTAATMLTGIWAHGSPSGPVDALDVAFV